MKIISSLLKKRLMIREIYKSGLGNTFFALRMYLPLFFLVIFFVILNILHLNTANIIDLIKQINSLVGIILGFSIASLAIFISINNTRLEDESVRTKYTFRQIGSALFFYNVEMSLFTAMIGIFLVYLNIPIIDMIQGINNLIGDNSLIENLLSKNAFSLYIFIFYMFCFLQLLFNLFYSSIFLNSSIKK